MSKYSMGKFHVLLTLQRNITCSIVETVQEISNCASQYKANLCGDNPVPAMIRQCSKWETCMNRDPTMVGRSRVSAELIGEVVNGFFEPISWKTMVFIRRLELSQTSPALPHDLIHIPGF